MIRSVYKKIIILLPIIFCLAFLAIPALAGDGDGSGGGKNEPLRLDFSVPADGAYNVAVKADITLTFTKNVVYMTVKDANSKCFTLSAADGNMVPIEVKMADDQIEPEKKRIVVIHPENELVPGIAYKLIIAPDFKAKSGASLGKKVELSFKTAAAATPAKPAAKAEAPAAKPAGQNNQVEPTKVGTSVKESPSQVKTRPAAAINETNNKDQQQMAREYKNQTKTKTPVAKRAPKPAMKGFWQSIIDWFSKLFS